ncbi:MAG: hypothetical protein GY940_25750 [bacterium]|nr:hypothetical protein [bacterium]
MKTRIILLLIFTLIWSMYLTGKTRVYEEQTEQQVDTHRFTIESRGNGYTIQLTTEKDSHKIHQNFLVDDKLATWNWNYHAPHKKTKISASRNGTQITLKGTDKGKPIEKTFDINQLPWNQTFNIGLERFALSDGKKKSMRFWAIGTSGMGNMKSTKFKVKWKKTETITLTPGNPPVEAVYMTISLSGILSMFWTGKYWYRKSDGVFLRYKGKNKSGAPVSVMKLVSEDSLHHSTGNLNRKGEIDNE